MGVGGGHADINLKEEEKTAIVLIPTRKLSIWLFRTKLKHYCLIAATKLYNAINIGSDYTFSIL